MRSISVKPKRLESDLLPLASSLWEQPALPPSVDLTAGPTNSRHPDGNVVPMWGYVRRHQPMPPLSPRSQMFSC